MRYANAKRDAAKHSVPGYDYFKKVQYIIFIDSHQENMRGQRGTLRVLAVICHSH